MAATALALLLIQTAAPTPAPPPVWRVAATGERSIVYVDETSVARTGDEIRFQLHQREPGEPTAADRALRSVTADCATGSWHMVHSWPYRENGRNLRAEDTLTMETQPGTVYGATLAAACNRRLRGAAIADVDRHARAFFTATGTVAERLAAAEAAAR